MYSGENRRGRDSNLAGHSKRLVFITNTSAVCKRQTLRWWIMYTQQSGWQCLQLWLLISDKDTRIITTILVTLLVCCKVYSTARLHKFVGPHTGTSPTAETWQPEKSTDIIVILEIKLHDLPSSYRQHNSQI